MYGPEKYGPGPNPDPYARPRYGGGSPYGNYGFSFYECCGPNIIPITAMILLFIVYCLFIPGFAAPYWRSYDDSAGNGNGGLWRECTKLTAETEENCGNLIDIDNKPDWLEATQGLMITALITLVLATALIIYWLCSYSRYFFIKILFLGLLFLTFIMSLIGVIIYGVNATDGTGNKYDFDWCFYLADVSTSVLLFVPILLLCVPSKENYPSFENRDRFGFGYPRPPPGPMGPPGPPRPGYGMAEPIAHVYPSSLPRTKPYGASSYPYPSHPYSSRY